MLFFKYIKMIKSSVFFCVSYYHEMKGLSVGVCYKIIFFPFSWTTRSDEKRNFLISESINRDEQVSDLV